MRNSIGILSFINRVSGVYLKKTNFHIGVSNRIRHDPRLEFDFIPATGKDYNSILSLSLGEFIKFEPHHPILNLRAEHVRPLHEYVLKTCLYHPFSMKIIEKSSGDLVGFRVMAIGHRNHEKDWEPFELDLSKLAKNAQIFYKMLVDAKEGFWRNVDQDIEKVLWREITFVSGRHQRKGIARHIVHLGIDFDHLRADGIQGIASEASSLANQNLLETEGYKCVFEPKYDWGKTLELVDGTKGLKVFFKDLRK